MYRFIVSFQPGQGLSSRREVVLVFWNVRWFGQHKLYTNCPQPVNKADDGTINAGFETDKRLFLISYCYTIFSSLTWFTDVSLSNTSWEPIHTNMLNAPPHVLFFFFFQCRSEQQFFAVEHRLSCQSLHWQNRSVRGTWPPLEVAASVWGWRCSWNPEMSMGLCDWLWLFPPSPVESGDAQAPVEKGFFFLWVSMCCFECFCFVNVLFFSRHSGASTFNCRNTPLPLLWKKKKPNTLRWFP